jgi:hypothetical protein
MCFSAEASFAGGIALSAIGIASLKKVSRPEQRPFAAIPLLFAAQQFAEGVVWITLKSGGNARLQGAAAYFFLITALVVWPVLVPLSMWFMEESRKRRNILAGLTAAGGILAVFYAYCLTAYNVTPQIQSLHIAYVDEFPGDLVKIAFAFYVASTIAPLFVSSVKRMQLFAVLIAGSCAVSAFFFAQYLTSVWCFFAALISVTIYWILNESRSKVGALETALQS